MTIRRVPDDFQVEELIAPAFLRGMEANPSPTCPFALYSLRKTSLSTPEAAAAFAKSVGVRPGQVHYAGLKDKHAITTQHVSIPTTGPSEAGKLPPSISSEGWRAARLGWTPAAVSAEHIQRNRFDIVVRDASTESLAIMGSRATLLSSASDDPGSGRLRIVNYFGDQRFGSARHGAGFAGARLVRADFEGAIRLAIGTPARKDTKVRRTFTRALAQGWGDWTRLAEQLPRCADRRAIEHLARNPADFRGAFTLLPALTQQMCVEAYQSHIWNGVARRLASSIARSAGSTLAPTPERPRVSAREIESAAFPAETTPDPFGEMIFPHARAIDDAWITLDVPLMAKSTQLAEPWAAAAAEVLAEEGLQVSDLRIPGVRRPYFGEAWRRLFVEAERFEMHSPEPDELSPRRSKASLRFELPRGSYATVVLRALAQ